MRAPAPVIIDIPAPCTQSWEQMMPVAGGRHCAQCAQTVIDFTTWSDAALYRYFAGNKGEACGRYLASQVGRPIAIPPQPHSRLYRMTVALGLTLLFTQAPDVLAQSRPPKQVAATSFSRDDKKPSPIDTMGTLQGTVRDEKREPMISAVVYVSQNGRLMGGSVTDYDGNFTIKPLTPGVYDVRCTYLGYDTVLIRDIVIPAGQRDTLQVDMKADRRHDLLHPVIMGGRMHRLVDEPVRPAEPRKKDEIEPMPIKR